MVAVNRLRRLGHQSWTFLEASGADEALEVWRGHEAKIDLIVVDELLGEGERGSDVIRRLREAGSKAVIVGISGTNFEQLHIEVGADLSWEKPFPGDRVR